MADYPRPSSGDRVAHDPGRARPSIDRLYTRTVRRWSDVQAHLPRFVQAVIRLNAQTVVELGSRSGVSTIAWLYALARTGGSLWTVDLEPAPHIGHHDRWTHLVGDDLAVEVLTLVPYEIDVLFVDTSHEYGHTCTELEVYVPRVRSGGVVLCHDTAVEQPDGVASWPRFPVRCALDRFTTERGLTWVEHPGSFGLGQIDVP